jgi:hypothetical protein
MLRRHLALAVLVYCAIAIVQIPAVVSGIHQLTGLWWLICVAFGLVFGSTPILGSLLGVHGAQADWGWSASASYLLFVGAPLFFLALGAVTAAAETLGLKPVPSTQIAAPRDAEVRRRSLSRAPAPESHPGP